MSEVVVRRYGMGWVSWLWRWDRLVSYIAVVINPIQQTFLRVEVPVYFK